MKRLLSWLLAAALVPVLCLTALAAGEAQLVRAFVYDGTLYAYVDVTGNDRPITQVNAQIGTQVFPSSARLETVRQAGAPVTWLLLLDRSGSMPQFVPDILTFAGTLAQAGGENTRFIVATFGDEFLVHAENLTAEELGPALEQVSYTDKNTRLLSGIAGALDYFEGIPRSGNELRGMVILTDAVIYDTVGATSYEELMDRVVQSDVMLHSVGFGTDAASLDSLGQLTAASRGGIHQVVGGELTARDAADTLTACTSSLSVTGFDLSAYNGEGGTEQVSVTFAADGELLFRAQAEVDIPAPDDSASDEDTPGNTPGNKLPDPSALPPSNAGQSGESGGAGSQHVETAQPPMLLIAGLGAVVVLAGLAAFLLLRRKPAPAAEEGIFMRLEVVRGQLAGKTTEFYLANELLIGREKTCQIAFRGGGVEKRHARVFTAEGVVYIEGLAGTTAVNGNPIQMPNILRSGDEISVGDAAFRLMF